MHGWLIIDKPLGLSSAQVVGRVKWLLKNSIKNRSEAEAEPAISLRSSVPSEGQETRRETIKKFKIGHAGTLDPLATGILPLAIGECTKVVQFLTDADKGYEFEVTWGEERSTDDAEGVVVNSKQQAVSREEVEAVMKEFMGEIEQVPPQYSAIKVDGQRAYALAREQKTENSELLNLKARKIIIREFKLLNHTVHSSQFAVHCSKGTYIRSIARDMGRMLGCYGYVSALRRVQHGKFSLSQAISLEKLEELCNNHGEQAAILPLDEILDDIPELKLSESEAQQIRNGIVLKTDLQDIPCISLYHDNILISIAEISSQKLITRRVFNL